MLLLGCWLSATFADTAGADPDVAYAERTLRAAGAATDGPGVLAFIRDHTLSDLDLDRLAHTVRLLGAADFSEREKASHALVAAGRPALPYLRAVVRDPDLEIARRARCCVEDIERSPTPFLMTAAAQLVKDRRPEGAAAVLLAYLPCIDEEGAEEIPGSTPCAWLACGRTGRTPPYCRP